MNVALVDPMQFQDERQHDFDMALTCLRRGDLSDAEFCRIMRRIGTPEWQIEHMLYEFSQDGVD